MLKLFITLSMIFILNKPALCQEIQDSSPTRELKDSDEGTVEDQSGTMESIFVNGGFHTEFMNNVQTNSSGTLRKIEFAPTLGMGVSYPISANWRFLHEVNWVLPKTSDDAHIIKNLFMLRADFGYNLLDWLRLRVGTSLMWLNQHGRGGRAKLNNGNDTSTFYYPNENRSSLNNTLDLGAEILLDHWSVRLQTYTYALFKEDRRQISYTLFLTYYWKQ